MHGHDNERIIEKMCRLLSDERRPCTLLRENILRVLLETSDVSVSELKTYLRKKYACIATPQALYANLKLFEALYLVTKKYDQKSLRFDLLYKRQQLNLTCTRCQRSTLHHESSFFDLLRQKCREKSFTPTRINLTLYGICKTCQIDNASKLS